MRLCIPAALTAAAAATLFATGCATQLTPQQWQENALGFIQDGRTTREQVMLKLGGPTGRFEADRILTYRIARAGDGDVKVVEREKYSDLIGDNWQAADYSLVLVFAGNIVEKHSVVPVR
jgi:hypothetical protein